MSDRVKILAVRSDGREVELLTVLFDDDSRRTPYSTPFDWNHDGHVDGVDLNHPYSRFATILKI